MKTVHYFAGGNTAQGFVSRFEDILPAKRQKRMYYLKGGPGVGKSTFMRRVAAAAEGAGLRVEYFHCSSDPDSLDGVALPELGAGLMDGTAPHVYDPVIPGARDTLLPLGDYLDAEALRPLVGEIAALQEEISGRFARCYRYLGAALQVEAVLPGGGEDPQKARALAGEWAGRMPRRGGGGSLRRLFAAAYTPKGRVDLLEGLGPEGVFQVACPLGCHPGGLMERLTEAALSRGLHGVQLLDPLAPQRAEGLLLPEHGLLFTAVPAPRTPEGSAAPGGPGEGGGLWPASALFAPSPQRESEQSFDRNAYELLLQRAAEQLHAAKTLHDRLEQPYREHMDFAKWQLTLDRVLEELGLAGDRDASEA